MADLNRGGFAQITLDMLRRAVEELQMKRALVSLKMIADHLRRFYPIERNLEALKIELKDKLDHAVSIGLLSRCRRDAYCLSTFRQEAYNQKTDLTSFWERYYKKHPGRRLRSINVHPKKKSDSRNNSEYSICSDDSSDDFTDSEDF